MKRPIRRLRRLTQIQDKEEERVNYLKASGLSVGLLINFGAESLQFKRIVYTH